MSGMVLLNLLSIFLTESSLKLSVSSTIQTSRILYSLSHRRLVADLSIFYRYFNGNCSQEIKNIIPDPVRRVRTTRSSTHSHPFQVTLPNPRTLATSHLSFEELLNYGTHCHTILSLNRTIRHLLNLTSTNLILSPFLFNLPHFLNFSFVGALL